MSNYDENFTKGIKQWATYDTQIELLNQKIKEIKHKRDNLEHKLTGYMQEHDLTKTAFNFNDNRVIFKNEAKYSNLSYDFLYKCSQDYFGDAKKAQHFCQFIKSNRQKTYNSCLKRCPTKNKDKN
jgi:hypothetical protein